MLEEKGVKEIVRMLRLSISSYTLRRWLYILVLRCIIEIASTISFSLNFYSSTSILLEQIIACIGTVPREKRNSVR